SARDRRHQRSNPRRDAIRARAAAPLDSHCGRSELPVDTGMTPPPRHATLAVALVLGFLSRAAEADCVIGGARPQGTLPTPGDGETFSFLASPDCETLRFSVAGSTLVKRPQPGPDADPGGRTYRVVLSQSEWESVLLEGDTTFTWTITGRTSTGVVTRLRTTNV